jgi:hypothetical protein
MLVEFWLTSKEEMCDDIINGLVRIRKRIAGNPFVHPLFAGVETNDFYAVLIDIDDHGSLLELFDRPED